MSANEADSVVGRRSESRPYKVASHDGMKRVGVVAATLEQLLEKGERLM